MPPKKPKAEPMNEPKRPPLPPVPPGPSRGIPVPNAISRCHGAGVTVHEGPGRTPWHRCEECRLPCEVIWSTGSSVWDTASTTDPAVFHRSVGNGQPECRCPRQSAWSFVVVWMAFLTFVSFML